MEYADKMTEIETKPVFSPSGLKRFKATATAQPFRGTVWENCKRYRLVGKAYESMPASQGGYFDIKTCRHLAGPLMAWIHPFIRKILVRKAIQTQGSMIIDVLVPYIIEHQPRNTLVLFETEEKALNYCSVRLMDTLYQHPVIGPMIQDVQQLNRFNSTTTFIKFPSMVLLVGGLNDSNVSSLSWPNVLISEAWFHKDDGLLFKAFGRTTQFEKDCKILVESQAGMEGEDFASECNLAHRIPLTWACPYCGHRQEWEFSQKRPDDYKPVERKVFADGELPMPAVPKPGSYAGMIIPASSRFEKGQEIPLTPEERAKGALWECYACGGRIQDTPQMRQALMDSYQQEIPDPAPASVLFDWPEEASLGVSFAASTQRFLVADAAQKQGNIVPKQDWYMQRRARTWNPNLTRVQVDISPGSYDPNQVIENEHSRNMSVDAQQDQDIMDSTGKSVTGWFWYIVRVVDKFGNSKQLDRGFAKSWDEWIKIQHKWKIPNDRVVIDIGHWPDQIMLEAAARHETIKIDRPAPPFYMKEKIVTWYLLAGSDDTRFPKHRDGQSRAWSPPQPFPITLMDKNGKRKVITLKKIRWSNVAFKIQLEAIRSGVPGMPKFEFLDRKFLNAQSQAMETGDRTYARQMDAEYYVPGKKKDTFEALRPDVHYRDCELHLRATDGCRILCAR